MRIVAACYLRSDKEGIVDTLTTFHAAEALYNVVAAESAFLHSRCIAQQRFGAVPAEGAGGTYGHVFLNGGQGPWAPLLEL